MSALSFTAMPTDIARAYQRGARDANGLPPETRLSDSSDGLCRHCLRPVPAGKPYLVLAYRPFPEPQPYAEVGPVFLHAEPCERHPDSAELPASFFGWPSYLLKGYGDDHRIVYGSGQVVETPGVTTAAAKVLERPEVSYVDIRSARNNCFQVRISRG